MNTLQRIERYLQDRKAKNEFRSLSIPSGKVDFTSNDYLGFSRSKWVQNEVSKSLENEPQKNGSTGSRLLSGNSEKFENLEQQIATFHNAESALIFNSGFDANLGLISTLCRPDDLIIFDKFVHASIHQGVKLSGARSISFLHNDVSDLKRILAENETGNCFVIIESVYSMDGDKAPLRELVELKQKFDFDLIVDEAHALGVFGKEGRGLCEEEGIEQDCLARVYTFGKGLGCHGAVVIGANLIKEYLVNFCKPFIYSTAISMHSLATVEHSYNLLKREDNQRVVLFNLIDYFKLCFQGENSVNIVGEGPIFGLHIEGIEQVRSLADHLNQNDFYVKPIVYPTVPRGTERIRIILHSYNTKQEIEDLKSCMLSYLKNEH